MASFPTRWKQLYPGDVGTYPSQRKLEDPCEDVEATLAVVFLM
jgi:hypothetical protein